MRLFSFVYAHPMGRLLSAQTHPVGYAPLELVLPSQLADPLCSSGVFDMLADTDWPTVLEPGC